MRIDVHPADFDHPAHMATLEELLARARGRTAVTYDELAGQPSPGPTPHDDPRGREAARTGREPTQAPTR
jgi:hypothetical protein